MQALKLTNSINILLNEDKFSKYTIQQVYDELGAEDFLDYVATTCTKIIKGLNNKFKTVVPHIRPGSRLTYPSINYYLAKTSNERFTIVMAFINEFSRDGSIEPRIEVYYNTDKYDDKSSHSFILGSATNLVVELGLAIKYCYKPLKNVVGK